MDQQGAVLQGEDHQVVLDQGEEDLQAVVDRRVFRPFQQQIGFRTFIKNI